MSRKFKKWAAPATPLIISSQKLIRGQYVDLDVVEGEQQQQPAVGGDETERDLGKEGIFGCTREYPSCQNELPMQSF